jgi:hypothetical protein
MAMMGAAALALGVLMGATIGGGSRPSHATGIEGESRIRLPLRVIGS